MIFKGYHIPTVFPLRSEFVSLCFQRYTVRKMTWKKISTSYYQLFFQIFIFTILETKTGKDDSGHLLGLLELSPSVFSRA